ncbi:hypothetical protein PAHAL_2G370200 [Panicum hallii]|uniref:Uncharacterized protein n=1 Tax=Panicum hallii TaxID=206008 RepID=A0A2S3H299_9POAL|nr:skin secretory protein xP2-like [Panicum hallii]PAN13879.1 hypothetical protein PAHAL_2G370200 [Panicum hallii]
MDRRPPLAVSPRRLRPRPHRVPRPPLVPASSVKTPPGSMKKAAAPMRASICAIPSPIRLEPSPMRASISALPSPARFEPSPARASTAAALPPPTRAKLDFPATASPLAKAPGGKENVLPAAAPSTPPAVTGSAEKENLLPAGADAHNELVALNLAAVARAAGTPAAGPLFVRGRLYDLYSARRDERLKRKHGFPYYEDSASAALDPEAMAEDPCVAVELSKRRVAKKAYATTGAESVRRSMPAADFAAGRSGGLGPRSSLRSSKEMKKASAASGTVSQAVKERRVNPRSSARRI